MKRILCFLLFASVLLGTAACGGQPAPAATDAPVTDPGTTDAPTNPQTTAAPTTDAPATAAAEPVENPMPEGDYVLLDGTGKTEGAYKTLLAAANALPATGGSIVVVGDVTTPSDTPTKLPAKPLTILSHGDAKLTLGRTTFFNDTATLTHLTLENGAASGLDYIYAQGHDLTVTDSVTTVENGSTSRQLSLFAGSSTNANITASSTLVLAGGEWRSVFIGNYSGTFAGNVTVNFDGATVAGGQVCFSNCNAGASKANVTVNVNAGDLAVFKRTMNSGTMTGTVTLHLFGGTVRGGELTLSDKTVICAETKTDLAVSGKLPLTRLTAGAGKLLLLDDASVSAERLEGALVFGIGGTLMGGHDYLTIKERAADATLLYQQQNGEEILKIETATGVSYQVTNIKMTKVRVYYGNTDTASKIQPQIVLIRGASKTGARLETRAGKENGVKYIEQDLPAGLYCYKVYYDSGSDYGIKYFYLDGSLDAVTYTMQFEPRLAHGYVEHTFSNTTDEVLRAFYNTADLQNFRTFDTPTFTKHTDDRSFTTHDDLCAYCQAIADACDCAYLFYPAAPTEKHHLQTPVLVFTRDKVAPGATIEEVAATVRAGGVRDILLLTGGQHGNEPAGEEAVLAVAKDLCGDYGEPILDRFGAIVMIPGVSTDNLYDFVRNYPDGCNSNRDLMLCEHDGSRLIVQMHNLFQPTVAIDCHEDVGVLTLDETDNSISDIHLYAIDFNGPANCPLNLLAAPDAKTPDAEGLALVQSLLDEMNAKGYRAQHYRAPAYYPICGRCYAGVRGCYSFLLEVCGINNGKGNFDIRVNANVTAVEAIIDRVMQANGEMARRVAAAREAVAVKIYDKDNTFVLRAQLINMGTEPAPSIYTNGTYKNENATRVWQRWSKVTSTRPMPTAYVIPADTPKLDAILALLDRQGIDYEKLAPGSTLSLKKYAVNESQGKQFATATMGKATDVTFEKGAYVIPTDTYLAYLVAYYFEPDSYTSSGSGYEVSFYKMGFMSAADALYRSEVDNIRSVIAPMLAQ